MTKIDWSSSPKPSSEREELLREVSNRLSISSRSAKPNISGVVRAACTNCPFFSGDKCDFGKLAKKRAGYMAIALTRGTREFPDPKSARRALLKNLKDPKVDVTGTPCADLMGLSGKPVAKKDDVSQHIEVSHLGDGRALLMREYETLSRKYGDEWDDADSKGLAPPQKPYELIRLEEELGLRVPM